MLYVCRSCLLRLGQPWQTSTRERPSHQLLPRTARRVVHAASAFVGPLDQRGPYMANDKFYSTPRNASWMTMLTKRQPKKRHMSSFAPEQALAQPVSTPEATGANPFHLDGAQDRYHIAQISSAIRDQECRQLDRARTWAGLHSYQKYTNAFYQWKRSVWKLTPASLGSQSKESVTPKAERVIKWIQSCQTVEEIFDTVPVPYDASDPQSDNNLVMVALKNAPDKAHLVLEYIFREHMPDSTYPFYLFEDALELLAARLHWDSGLDNDAVARELADLVSLVLTHTEKKTHVRPTQSTIYRILYFLPTERIQSWYEELRDASFRLSVNTQLHFASRLADSPNGKALSVDILRHLQSKGLIDINDIVPASITTSILMFKAEQLQHMDSSMPTPADLFGALRDLGLNPNIFTYVAMMRSLCLRRDINTALEVADVMRHQGIEHNAYTYSVLIHGCRLSDAWETLADLAVEAWRAGMRDPVLWNEVIYAVHICCRRQKREQDGIHRPSLFPLNAIYTRIFDGHRLRPFISGRTAEVGAHLVGSVKDAWFPEGLQRLEREISPLSQHEVLQPGLDTLCIMLLGIVRHLAQPLDLVNFYIQFRQLLQEGHPDAVRLVRARGTFVYDIVLRSLVTWRGTMRIVIEIVRDMMGGVHEYGRRRSRLQPPAPSTHTWATLIKGFMINRRTADAERCIDIMRQQGIEPNNHVWNQLAVGYSHLQDVHGTVDSMRRLEAAGFEADPRTMHAFAVLRNQHLAVQLMEQMVEKNRRLEDARQKEQKLNADQQVKEHDEHTAPAGERPEDSSLDSDLEARFDEKDPGTMSMDLSRQMLDHIDHAREQSSSGFDLDAALAQLETYSTEEAAREKPGSHYHGHIQRLQEIAPVDDQIVDMFEEWRRVRDGGLDAAPPPKSLLDVSREGRPWV